MKLGETTLDGGGPYRILKSRDRGLRLDRGDLVESLLPLAVLPHHDGGDEGRGRYRLAFVGSLEPRREGPHGGIGAEHIHFHGAAPHSNAQDTLYAASFD